ncbi:MAG: DUF2752 domain-containing protein [Ginsengibacter sp.]|jgi:hypothetical protein
MKIFSLKITLQRYGELAFWIAGLILLATLNPAQKDPFSLCLSGLIGIDSCPGCGLGRSISFLLQGNPSASLEMHPLGIFALPVILHRIYTIFKINFIPTLKTTKS